MIPSILTLTPFTPACIAVIAAEKIDSSIVSRLVAEIFASYRSLRRQKKEVEMKTKER